MTPDDHDDARRLVHLEQRAAMALAGIQAAMLLNGGAAVAILALIGSLAGAPSASIVDVSTLKWSLLIFGFGVFTAACTYMIGFWAQDDLIRDPKSPRGVRMKRWGSSVIGVSLILFLLGVAIAAAAML
jgi:hypothetical protein